MLTPPFGRDLELPRSTHTLIVKEISLGAYSILWRDLESLRSTHSYIADMWRKLTPRKRRVLSTFEWKLHAYIKGKEGEMVLHLVVRGETFYDLVALFMNK